MAARTTKKSFTAKKKAEPIVFDLFGEDFTAHGSLPGAVLLDYIEASEEQNSAAGIRSYLQLSMTAEEYERFDAYTRDPENDVDLETLSEIVSFLIEAQTSRPTKAS